MNTLWVILLARGEALCLQPASWTREVVVIIGLYGEGNTQRMAEQQMEESGATDVMEP